MKPDLNLSVLEAVAKSEPDATVPVSSGVLLRLVEIARLAIEAKDVNNSFLRRIIEVAMKKIVRCDICRGAADGGLCRHCAETRLLPEDPSWTKFFPASFEGLDPEMAKVAGVTDAKVWINSRYQVVERFFSDGPFGPMHHLSIRRIDRRPVRNWRDFQRIKNELVGSEAEGVELFPAESRLVDAATQYHLWVFPDSKFPFGFDEGRWIASEATQGAKQVPFEKGSEPPDAMTKADVDKLIETKLASAGEKETES